MYLHSHRARNDYFLTISSVVFVAPWGIDQGIPMIGGQFEFGGIELGRRQKVGALGWA
jgi:hypothetical protein